jgi:hypothetical protein
VSETTSLQAALGLLSAGDASGAVSVARAAIQAGPQDPSKVLDFGMKLRSASHPQDSIPFFDYALLRDPTLITAHIGKAKSLCDIKERPLAMQEVDKVRLLAGDDIAARTKLFELYVYLQAFLHADELIDALIGQNPEAFSLRKNKVMMLLHRGKPDWAEIALTEALDLPDLTVTDWTFAARTFLQLRKPLPAGSAAQRAIQMAPAPAVVEHLLLAQSYLEEDKAPKARQTLDAIRPAVKNPQDLLQAAEIYLAAGDLAPCRELVNRFLTSYEGREIPLQTRLRVARLLAGIGDQTMCKDILEAIAIKTIKDKATTKILHNTAYDLRFYKVAEAAAQHGLSLSPYDPHYLNRLAELKIIGQADPIGATKTRPAKGLFAFFRRA